jgi:hypothetical protein
LHPADISAENKICFTALESLIFPQKPEFAYDFNLVREISASKMPLNFYISRGTWSAGIAGSGSRNAMVR